MTKLELHNLLNIMMNIRISFTVLLYFKKWNSEDLCFCLCVVCKFVFICLL